MEKKSRANQPGFDVPTNISNYQPRAKTRNRPYHPSAASVTFFADHD
jgi:hypothetical protein